MNTIHLPPPVSDHENRKDREELFDITLNVALFLHSWGQGDEHEIQKNVTLLHEWMKAREDRLTKEQLEGKVA